MIPQRKQKDKARSVWRFHNGKIPLGYHIHHIDGNHQNNNIKNLKLVTIKEHAELHKEAYLKNKRWQDYYAWKGLSGQLKKQDLINQIYKENGKQQYIHMHTKEARKKMAMTKKGSKLTEEHRKKISEGLKGRIQGDYQKRRAMEARQKEWLITNPQGRTFAIKNLLDFARKNNLDQGNLVKVAQRKLNSHKGFIVAYK